MAWGGAVTGMAALSGFGVGAGTIAGGLGIGAMNPLGTALLGIGEGSAGSTHAGVAPSAAPKGSGGGGHTQAGAPEQIGQVGNQPKSRSSLALDPGTFCAANPRTCAAAAETAAEAVAPFLGPALAVAGVLLIPTDLGDLPPPPPPSLIVYRTMRARGLVPEVGASGRTLGARPGYDVPADTVVPGPRGLSVSPGSPSVLPDGLRPRELGGMGKDPVWALDVRELPLGLKYVPDPRNPTRHGFIAPSIAMPFDTYQSLLHSTAPSWVRVFP